MSSEMSETRLARVAHVLNLSVLVINKGKNEGVKVGDRFLVFGVGEEVNDPATGASLGYIELVRGRGRVVHVQDKMATLQSMEMRMVGRTRRTIREGNFILGTPKIVEEEPGVEQELPFDNPEVGDYAKPI